MKRIILGDSSTELPKIADASVDLIYIDPPFNTGKTQELTRIRTVRDDENGDRTGFQGKRYRTITGESHAFNDRFDDFPKFIEPFLVEGRRLLSPSGSFFLHLDYREVHYCKVLLDEIFGRESFINEIIWAYDYGARSRTRWSPKHNNILWYAKDPYSYTFNYDEIERIPYKAPSLVGPEKAARGKTPTDVWEETIVHTNGHERTGYPTQKPLKIINRIVRVHSNPGNLVLDCFAGSGTLGEAAARNDRQFILIDSNPEAVEIIAKRLAFCGPECVNFTPQLQS